MAVGQRPVNGEITKSLGGQLRGADLSHHGETADRTRCAQQDLRQLRRQVRRAGDGSMTKGLIAEIVAGHGQAGLSEPASRLYDSPQDAVHGCLGHDPFRHLDQPVQPGQVPLPLDALLLAIGHVHQTEGQPIELAAGPHHRHQRPVPVRDAALGLVDIHKGPGHKVDRPPGVPDLLEDGPVLLVGKEGKVVVAQKLLSAMAAAIDVGGIGVQKVELGVQVSHRRLRAVHDGIQGVALLLQGQG